MKIEHDYVQACQFLLCKDLAIKPWGFDIEHQDSDVKNQDAKSPAIVKSPVDENQVRPV